MGLFDKKYCTRCNKELGLIFGKVKIADGTICKDCNALLSPLLTKKSTLTLNDIERHLIYRKANQNTLNSFKATTILGNKERVYFDDEKELFVVSNTNDFVAKNVDVFKLSEVSMAELKTEETKEEILTKDAEGKEVSFDPKQYEKFYKFKIELTLTHTWIKNLEIDVTDDEISEKDNEELLRNKNLANEILAKLLKKEFVAETSTETNSDSEHWVCAKCNQENSNTSKFCTNCGEAKPSGAKFCGECGEKLPVGVKFCPNCGKAINQ